MSEWEETTGKENEKETLKRVDEYLKGYGFHRRLLRLARYEKEYFGVSDLEEAEMEILLLRLLYSLCPRHLL